jgi:hypothetical protein
MDGIASVQARIQDIITQFQGPPASTLDSSSDSSDSSTASTGGSTSDFAAALAQAQSPSGSSAATPAATAAATGAVNKVGVDPAQWAQDFLTQLGAPITSSNLQAVTAWEQAESGGGGGHFNPLNTTQGGFAGETSYNSIGVKNYASYQDGINANVKVITNGLYSNILAALQQGTSAQAVAQAVANSPWGTGTGVERVLASQAQSPP